MKVAEDHIGVMWASSNPIFLFVGDNHFPIPGQLYVNFSHKGLKPYNECTIYPLVPHIPLIIY